MLFNFNVMDNIKSIISGGANSALTQKEIIEFEIDKWKKSEKRKTMITGFKYYHNEHDILNRKRMVIGASGQLEEVKNLPNNRTVDNQYAKMVDQKKNYLLGKPLTFGTDNEEYEKQLKDVFNKRFQRTFKNLGGSCLNGGIAWLYPYPSENGELAFRRFEPYEILPFWKDAEHTILEFAVRVYEVQAYDGKNETTLEKVEIYTAEGIDRYILAKGKLVPDVDAGEHSDYLEVDGKGYNWDGKIPLIPFKYNSSEIPLIIKTKSLQDGINLMLSNFQNNMEEDARNTILVIHNYDGADLGVFRQNLAQYGAVKVRTIENQKGGVDTLTVEVDAENYKVVLQLLKKALIENARGFDAKDDRLMNSPNEMNIQSIYNDIDLDANDMETEFQASFEDLLWFVDAHLANTNKGDFSEEPVEVIFDRDVLVNESQAITNCKDSVGILSMETIVSQHPYVTDVNKELERIQKEREEQMDNYMNAFNPISEEGEGDEED